MNTQEIDRFLFSDSYSQVSFGVTLARNVFQENYDRSLLRLFVVNTQPGTMPSEHWLAVFRGETATILFDPYGFSTDHFYPEIFTTIVKADGAPPIASNISLQ